MRSWPATLRALTTPRDVLLAAAFAVVAVVETLAVSDAPHPPLRSALAAVTVLGLVVRRRHPMACALVVAGGLVLESVLAESPDEVAVLLAVVLAAFSVAAYSPVREAVAGAAVLSMAIAVAIALDPSDSPSNIVPTLLLFVAVPAVIGGTVHRRQRDIAALELEAEVLAHEAAAAVEAERRRIARELHDVVSHAVTLVAVQAEAGQSTLDTDPDATRRSLAAIAEASRDALTELHRMLALLDEDEPAQGTVARVGLDRVDTLVEGARSAGLVVTLERRGTPVPLPVVTDECAYRVVQEGLTNALRHSSGGRVTLTLSYDPDEVRLEVDSSGLRHQSAYGGTGRGLVGLRERVRGLGGELEAGPTERGYLLRATLPSVSRVAPRSAPIAATSPMTGSTPVTEQPGREVTP